MRPSRREDLVDAAMRVFQRDGFHATGIEKVLEEAGVSKMTLYNHFRSKDDLILAALRRRDEMFRNEFFRGVEARGGTASDRLLAIFDVLSAWFNRDDFSGCMFINAVAEFGGRDDAARLFAAEHKRLLLEYIRGICVEAGADDPDALAEEICLLMEGATVMAHVCADCDAAGKAKKAAERLLVSHAVGSG